MNYTVEISTDGPVRMDVGSDSNIITILKGAPVHPKAHNRYPKDYQSKYVIFFLHFFFTFYIHVFCCDRRMMKGEKEAGVDEQYIN